MEIIVCVCVCVCVCRLEFYGVELFRACDQHGVELGLGITCRGISVYKGRTHIITFEWYVSAWDEMCRVVWGSGHEGSGGSVGGEDMGGGSVWG